MDSDDAILPLAGIQEIGKRLSAGETVTASEVRNMTLNYDDDTTSPSSGSGITLTMNRDGSAVAVINNVEHVFPAGSAVTTDGNLDYYQVEDDDNDRYFSFWGASSWLGDITSEDGTYASVVGAQTNITSGDPAVNDRLYAVVGDQTEAANLQATATYTGNARFDVFPNTDFVNNGTSRIRYRGDTTVNADFASATVDGTMNNWTVQLPGSDNRTDVAGTVQMNQASITGSTFNGTLSGSGFANAEVAAAWSNGGQFSGGFYGPNGEEVAGTMTVNSTGVDGVSSIGFFTGKK